MANPNQFEQTAWVQTVNAGNNFKKRDKREDVVPRISIIVPIYKVEPYLHECIESILSQTYQDFELILVDDGSPDNCGAICDEYAEKDSRIRVIHQQNGGLSAARNAGLDIAQGEYVTFVDSDDVLHPYYLEYLMRGLTENHADISLLHFVRFSEGDLFQDAVSYSVKAIKTGVEACYSLYSDDAVIYTIACGKLYKTKLFQGVRYPVGKIHEDEGTTYKLLYKAEKVAELDTALYGYRINANGIMGSSFSPKRYQAVEFFKERIKFFEEQGLYELAERARQEMPLTLAKMYIMAKNAGVEKEIPKEYQMRELQALKKVYDHSTNDNFEYYLSLVHPNWLRPHAYLRKIKKILHIPCK